MEKFTIGLLDPEKAFVEAFVSWAQCHEPLITLEGFWEEEAFLARSRETEYTLWLVSAEFFCEKPYEERENLCILHEGSIPKEWQSKKLIFKYQSAEEIIQECLVLGSRKRMDKIDMIKSSLIGVTGLEIGPAQSQFTFAMANAMGKEGKKVLYLSFLKMNLLDQILEEESRRNLGDVWYEYQTSGKELTDLLGIAAKERGNVTYVAGVKNPFVLEEIAEEDLGQFLEELRQKGGFDTIVVDLESMGKGFRTVLRDSDICFCFTGTGYLTKILRTEFLGVLEGLGEETGKVHFLEVPQLIEGTKEESEAFKMEAYAERIVREEGCL